MSNSQLPEQIGSPFGGEAKLQRILPAAHLNEMYLNKCGLDISSYLYGSTQIGRYKCSATGYLFWRPAHIAGCERFYSEISAKWKDYYRKERWEYPITRKYIQPGMRLLEIGCGRGYFLRSIESKVTDSIGLELNVKAIEEKVTAMELRAVQPAELFGTHQEAFDVVCMFQVLEHIADPYSLLSDAVALLKPGGLLIISTPNYEYPPFFHMEDAFDLPPHHIGHFTDQTFEHMQSVLPIALNSVHKEIRTYTAPITKNMPNSRLTNKILSLISRTATNLNYRINSEPGPTILATYKKLRTDSSVSCTQ